jgi:hypothetical protein
MVTTRSAKRLDAISKQLATVAKFLAEHGYPEAAADTRTAAMCCQRAGARIKRSVADYAAAVEQDK